MNVRFDGTVNLPLMGRAASVRTESVNREARTVDIVWTTGAIVQRRQFDFDEGMVEYDEELVVSGNSVRLDRLNAGAPFLDTHLHGRIGTVLGSVVPGSVRIEQGKGYATIRLTAAEDAAGDVQRIVEGTIRHVSVGYRVHRYEVTKQDGQRDLWRAVDWEPMEISAVPIPADPGAHIRGADVITPSWPCAISSPHALRNGREQKPKGHSMNVRVPPSDTDLQARASAVVTNAGLPDSLADELASRDGMTVTRLDALLPALRHVRQCLARQNVSDDDILDFTRDFLDGSEVLQGRTALKQAAIDSMLDFLADRQPGGGRTYEPSFSHSSHQRMASMLDAVEDGILARLNPDHKPTAGREFAGMTLAETAAAIRSAKGLPPITGGPRAIIDVELGLHQRAVGMHATGDFPAVLGNVANKSLLAHYQAAQSALLRLSRRRQAADFKPISNIRLGGAMGLDKVPESAEYTYGTVSESSEKFVIATYGKIIALTRQLLINDDLGAFNDFTRIQGHGAAETEANLMVGLLEANSGAGPTLADGNPVFHASRGNIATGAAPSITAVSAMQTILRRQKGLGGEAIHVVPFALVVPPELETAALQVVAELYPADTASANPFTNRLEVVVEPRLADTGAWYLTAAPGQPDSLQHAYLASEPGPQFFSRVGWEVDGVEFKCRLDFGAGFVSAVGWVKNPGA